MKRLNEIELKNIEGGGISFGLVLGLGALITFVMGFIDGWTRPLPCRK
jgi:lactobin A/cerein 7B family class IIb bacteriocin